MLQGVQCTTPKIKSAKRSTLVTKLAKNAWGFCGRVKGWGSKSPLFGSKRSIFWGSRTSLKLILATGLTFRLSHFQSHTCIDLSISFVIRSGLIIPISKYDVWVLIRAWPLSERKWFLNFDYQTGITASLNPTICLKVGLLLQATICTTLPFQQVIKTPSTIQRYQVSF